MLSVTNDQLNAWIALYAYPTIRILALLVIAPVFNNVALPRHLRLVIGLAISVAIAPALPVSPEAIAPGSAISFIGILREMLIGFAIGFAIRLVFVAIDLAGDLIGLQMGLSFAVFFDPQAAGQTTVLAQFLGLFATLTFLALDGHLLTINVLAHSFEWLPAGEAKMSASAFMVIVKSAAAIFSSGLLIALPAVSALLVTNIALGVLTRAAPALNLFSLGFPITLAVGTFALMFSLPMFAPAFQSLYERAFEAVGLFLRLAAHG
ncbi:flagellar biosynthetic protein FliR [Niveibacterium terrae]|uniref:flagellar biosynthetic protein FliR n=1 Tax=Niveibacterium terrae TaxID=3373598 RepID=UPI003A8D0F52